MPPLPQPLPDEQVESASGTAEEFVYATGMDLQAAKTKQRMDRMMQQGSVQTHLHRIIVAGIYLLAVSAAAMFIVVVWHAATPWPFLSPEQLTNLKQLLFSGAIGAGASSIAKKHLGFQDDGPPLTS